MSRKHPEEIENPKSKRLTQRNYFFGTILISMLVAFSVSIWSEYLIRFFDMLPGNETERTIITVFGGLLIFGVFTWILWKFTTREYKE